MQYTILILCWLGVFQCGLLSFFFLSAGNRAINQVFLGIAMLMVGLRTAKSTMYLFYPETPQWFINLGFAAHAAIAPLLLLYVLSIRSPFKWSNWNLLHFVPAALITVLATKLSLDNFWYQGGYAFLLYVTLTYSTLYTVIYTKIVRVGASTSNLQLRWVTVLIITLTLFQLSYFSNYILRLTDYSSGPVAFSVVIYLISFVAIKNNQAFLSERKGKYKNINLTPEMVNSNLEKIRKVMDEQRPYLKADFSLQRLSELTKLPSYYISNTLSSGLEQNFNLFINTYRVRDAQRLLNDPTLDHLTIASLAFECGFHSLSSFNSAFKRITGKRPSDFRRGAVKTSST